MMEKREKIPYFERRVEAKDKVFVRFCKLNATNFSENEERKNGLGKAFSSPRKWI
jgi:hypothetical protein